MRTADAARRAASRLDFIASLVLALISLAALGCIAAGGVVLAQADSRGQRGVGALLMVGGLVGWLFAILPYLAAQALARYIEFRVEAETQKDGFTQG